MRSVMRRAISEGSLERVSFSVVSFDTIFRYMLFCEGLGFLKITFQIYNIFLKFIVRGGLRSIYRNPMVVLTKTEKTIQKPYGKVVNCENSLSRRKKVIGFWVGFFVKLIGFLYIVLRGVRYFKKYSEYFLNYKCRKCVQHFKSHHPLILKNFEKIKNLKFIFLNS